MNLFANLLFCIETSRCCLKRTSDEKTKNGQPGLEWSKRGAGVGLGLGGGGFAARPQGRHRLIGSRWRRFCSAVYTSGEHSGSHMVPSEMFCHTPDYKTWLKNWVAWSVTVPSATNCHSILPALP